MSLERVPPRHSLIDVLDKGIVIDASVKVSLLGIEIIGVDAHVMVASIQTYEAGASNATETRIAAQPFRRSAPPTVATGAAPRRRRRVRDSVNVRCERGCTFVMKRTDPPSTVTCPFDGSRVSSVAAPPA